MKFKFKTAQEYVDFLTKADEDYYLLGDSGISDKQYDEIKDEFTARFPEHEYLKVVGAKVSSSELPKVKHEIKMGSQAKVNTPAELIDWHNKQVAKVGNKLSYVVSEKIDGFSLSLKYVQGKLVQALTRGDGIEGEDVTSNVKKMKQVPLKLKKNVDAVFRGEAVIFIDDFNEYFSDKANPRNAAAGVARRLDGERCEHLNFLCYDIIADSEHFDTEVEKLKYITSQGFVTPEYSECTNEEEVIAYWESYEKGKRSQSKYEMDGLVVTINQVEFQEELGIIDQRPRYSRAFKFSAQIGSTTIEKVSWFVGRTGRITPVAEVKPIKLSGVTITNVTLHNLSEMRRLKIKIGSTVNLKRAGDVIPKIEAVTDNKGEEVEVPTECPSCGHATTEEDVFLWCHNKSSCPAQLYESLLHWVKSLEIKGFGDELVLQLVEAGLVKEPADFYKLTKDQVSALERRGEKSSTKVLEALHNKKELTIPQLIKGLGFYSISDKIAEVIQGRFHTLEEMKSSTETQLAEIHGIGEKVAANFKKGLAEKEEIIENLLKHITLKPYMSANTEGKLSGISFCFTGVRDKNLETDIVSQGGKIASGVSKTLTYLVAKDPEESSSKLNKARELGIEILSLAEAQEKIK